MLNKSDKEMNNLNYLDSLLTNLLFKLSLVWSAVFIPIFQFLPWLMTLTAFLSLYGFIPFLPWLGERDNFWARYTWVDQSPDNIDFYFKNFYLLPQIPTFGNIFSVLLCKQVLFGIYWGSYLTLSCTFWECFSAYHFLMLDRNSFLSF